MNTRTMASKKQIYDFWKKDLIAWGKHNKDTMHLKTCFACQITANDISNESDYEIMIYRAHIVAKCKGGLDSAENLHLLCRECHNASEYKSREKYWEWFKKRQLIHSLQIIASYENQTFEKSVLQLLPVAFGFEKQNVSERAKEVMRELKKQGVKLGRPCTLATPTVRTIQQLRMKGWTLLLIADKLNANQVPTARGGLKWYTSTVSSVLRTYDFSTVSE